MSMRTVFLTLLVLAAPACDRPPVDPSTPAAYAVQLPLEPAPGGRLQRLALPAAALVTLRRADLGDIRLFDARGKVVPIALVDDRADGVRRTIAVPLYPVIGPASALGKSGVSIRIEGDRVARVVTVDSGAPPADRATASAAVLLDTRGLRDPATGIAVEANIPPAKPVTLTLVSSGNLKDWEPLAEKVLFRPSDDAAFLGGATVALPGIDLAGRYVGISWGGATGVTLKAASVITSTVAAPARIAVATTPVALVDPHELRFDRSAMARLAAVRFTNWGADGVIPVKLYGRDHAEDGWILLSATTLRPGGGTNLLELAGPPLASYRIEADRRTAGFSAAPNLELLFDPVELMVALSGTPPYRLAVGQEAAAPTYLTRTEIAPEGTPLDLARLPRARLVAPDAPVITLRAGPPDGALEPRKLLLWAALLIGTLVLAFAAYRLLRATAATPVAKSE